MQLLRKLRHRVSVVGVAAFQRGISEVFGQSGGGQEFLDPKSLSGQYLLVRLPVQVGKALTELDRLPIYI